MDDPTNSVGGAVPTKTTPAAKAATKTTPKAPAKPAPKAKTAVKATTAKAKPSTSKPVKVPAREAAKIVLIEAGRPMHYREISQYALESGIVRVRGGGRRKVDPAKLTKTIRSFLAGSVHDKDSEFVRVDSGVFDLKERQTKATAAAKKVAAKAKAKA